MQISLNWINELVTIETVNLKDLIDKLTLGGFEIEEIIEREINSYKEITLDISATANRSDSLSIQGISKEIAALLDRKITTSNYSIRNLEWKKKIETQSITIPENDECSTFVAMTVENIENITAPNWLKQKLISSGFDITNDLLDFQNYILLESGYPFEFYDLDRIYSQINLPKLDLIIENANNDELFLASNNITYKLNDLISVVKVNKLPLSIAGIISHKEFAYSKKTKKLLIEGSIFNSTNIRRKSRQLGLRTERSARYEKSLKNTNLLESFYKLIYLLRISNPNLTVNLHTLNELEQKKVVPILLKYNNIKEILGPIKTNLKNKFSFINPGKINDYLNRLNFKYDFNQTEFIWTIRVPYERSEDITCEIDLIEEIGRLHGFNRFLTRLPEIKSVGSEDFSYQTRKKIISCFLNLGFNELIHYSLVTKSTFTKNKIQLVNPLSEDYSCLRTSLLPSLIETVQNNLKQGNQSIEGFEFGHVFLGQNRNNLVEKECLAGIFGGIDIKTTWSESPNPISWFEAKGKIEQFFKQLEILPIWQNSLISNGESILHPYCTAELSLSNGNYLGMFGQINPILAKRLNIPFNIYLFEFDFNAIQNQIQINKLTSYNEYFLYPKIIKDLSFIVNQNISFEEIRSILYLNGTKFLSEINLLDEYRGLSIPEKQTSLCLQLIFHSNERTLENKEIEGIIHNLKSILKNKFNIKVRV